MQTIRPADAISETICVVGVVGNKTISLSFRERNDEFKTLVKSLGFRWNYDCYCWCRSVSGLAEPMIDRLIETACAIVEAGFIVSVADNIYKNVILQDYTPEHRCWILVGAGEFDGWFRLFWKRSGGDFWQTARNYLTGNRYDRASGCLHVPAEHFAEVEDFAKINGFRFSPKALILLAAAKECRAAAITVNLVPKRHTAKPKKKVTSIDILDKYNDAPYHNFSIKAMTEMFAHQKTAVSKMLSVSIGALFMDMGTGKTRVAIELILCRQHRISNVIWFCPVSLKETILQEIKKHTNTTSDQIYKFNQHTSISNLPAAFWYIVGIETMSSSERAVFAVHKIINKHSFVIVDESSYIKGHNSIRSQRITDLAEHAKYRLILTGTPISQGIVDLYSQMRFLSPDILGYSSFYSFAANHLEYSSDYPGMIVRSHNTDRISQKIEPIVYQIDKAECLDLPDKLYDTVYFEMTDEQRSVYNQAKFDLFLSLDIDTFDSYVIFKLFSALQQIVSGYWKNEGTVIEFKHERLDTLAQVIESIPGDAKVIIWCKYKYSIQQISNLLPTAAVLYGDLNEVQRQNEIEKFKKDTRFLVATQSTGGHGLTLNEAHWVIFYENEFKYSNRLQSEDRCHRIGQKEAVTYIDVRCSGSIDERIAEALDKKGNLLSCFKDKLSRNKINRLVEEL